MRHAERAGQLVRGGNNFSSVSVKVCIQGRICKTTSMLINRSHAFVCGLSQIGQAYWSDELGEAQAYGDITVTMETKKLMIGLVIREFCVRC